MKEKEEILKSYNITPETRHHVYDKYLYPKIVKAMEEYGRLMYNQALDDAVKEAEVDSTYNMGYLVESSILKLKKI
jgi:hypothetical protein